MGPDDDPFMRNTDALTWNMEHDPGLRSTIVSVTWMDARPDFEVLSARLDTVTRLVPRFRQRPVRPSGFFTTRGGSTATSTSRSTSVGWWPRLRPRPRRCSTSPTSRP